jgi:nucleotide-binding universal stress UspA family protein
MTALTTALELANRLRAPVVIVRTWSVRSVPRPPSWEDGYRPSAAEMSEAVHDRLVKDVWASIACFPDVDVACHAVQAGPVRGLVDASRGVRMLVVGSSGRSPLRGSALGPVVDQCVRDAVCPVLVVRPRP